MAEVLSNSDAFMWRNERDPLLRSTIVTLILLDRCPDWHQLVDRFDRLSRTVPRFRQRVIPSTPFVPPRWDFVSDFDLGFHLRRVTAPEPGNIDALLELARVAAMADFDRARPLWEATLVDGLSDGGAAVLVKFNHALTDGVGAVEMARILYDTTEYADRAAHEPKLPEPTGQSRLGALRDVVEYQTGLIGAAMATPLKAAPAVLRAISRPVDAVAGGWSTATSILRTARPVSKPRSPIMVDRSLIRHVYVHELPKSALRRAGHLAGGSLNDAFAAAVAGGLRVYHVKHNAPVDELMLSMPINLRTEADPMGGNRTTLIRFDIPVGIADPVERIRVVHDRTDKARNEKSLAHTELIAGALNLMPRSYVGSAMRNVDLIASNVPGFPGPVAFAGARVRMQYAFSPTLGAALNVTLLSHVDTCALGINLDGAAVPDHDVLFDCLTAGFDEVLALAR
ncbi:wax ester/triacylglycerol synthase domain-containing protein [Mycolicibacterium elephantis]|uniref:diacylglycerol O-acyltransferase n=1 Tax=Mycolicibacterium elephantis TaxID=81858 RepID=A0A0M2ZL95_9MYCO|nr:wax ester/triacylglycerol synthase domain-containing protein [Mycolicibacterium elephantis]KKW66291.1 diacylglycerol O-acyltransferase [Mycolicibacterium elephantis]OBB23321.1 diacylglycerol O-acyltransferase [Mycolicibacterium elephantis]OBE98841.1 diacylglycerol O-acyltransferase [Mycolicibacterium elephantis]ORA59616.1 diacylglycerol O-acyltransferase [Mycolicibacterium elephantis]